MENQEKINLNGVTTEDLVEALTGRDEVNIYFINEGVSITESLGEYKGKATVVIINA